VVGAFRDGQSALNLAAARLRHIAGTAWSSKRYLNIGLLKDQQMRGAITASATDGYRSAQTKVRKILDTTKLFDLAWPRVGWAKDEALGQRNTPAQILIKNF
jgi:hypothetical protein